jgi:hypothetical protein
LTDTFSIVVSAISARLPMKHFVDPVAEHLGDAEGDVQRRRIFHLGRNVAPLASLFGLPVYE